MMGIALTRGKIAYIDEIDQDLAKKKWQAKREGSKTHEIWYAVRGLPGMKSISLHREIATRMINRKIKQHERVDHINHNGLDNRRENLRVVTGKENLMNCAELHWTFKREKTVNDNSIRCFLDPEDYEAVRNMPGPMSKNVRAIVHAWILEHGSD